MALVMALPLRSPPPQRPAAPAGTRRGVPPERAARGPVQQQTVAVKEEQSAAPSRHCSFLRKLFIFKSLNRVAGRVRLVQIRRRLASLADSRDSQQARRDRA